MVRRLLLAILVLVMVAASLWRLLAGDPFSALIVFGTAIVLGALFVATTVADRDLAAILPTTSVPVSAAGSVAASPATVTSERIAKLPASPSIDRAALAGERQAIATRASALFPTMASVRSAWLPAVLLGIGTFIAYIWTLGLNPPGFFCDEAEIGLESWLLLHGKSSATTIPFFYHHLGYSQNGTLPLFTTAPFIALLGPTEFAVRCSAAFFTALSVSVVFLTLRRLKVPYAVVPALAYGLLPINLHLGHVNFGHAPALFVMALGFHFWVRAMQQNSWWSAILSGVLVALSIYGNGMFYFAGPLVEGLILFATLLALRSWASAKRVFAGSLGGFLLLVVPVIYWVFANPDFFTRLNEKTGPDYTVGEAISNTAASFMKYLSYDFLFRVGDPGPVLRHSVTGAGLLYPVLLPILLVGLLGFLLWRGDRMRVLFLPMMLYGIVFPISGAISNPPETPPYVLGVYSGVLAVPFIIGYLVRWLSSFRPGLIRRPALAIATAILLLVGAQAYQFWTGPYAAYPAVAADYWGWQWGMRESMDYALEHRDQYDEFWMNGDWNDAWVIQQFYAIEKPEYGSVQFGLPNESVNLNLNQAFLVRADFWTNGWMHDGLSIGPNWDIVDRIYYPNGGVAFYVLVIDRASLQAVQD